MKNPGWLAFLIIFFAFQFFNVSAQTNKKAEIKRIDAYCKTVDAFVKKYKSPQLIFADVSDYNESEPKWKKFASAKSLEEFRETGETYSISYNWQKKGKIIMSSFTLFSPSGDWAKYVYLYFRADGTLAKAESELRTFVGSFIAMQDFYFDRTGRILKKTVEYKDLESEKTIQPSKDFLEANSAFINEDNYYKNTRRLPFAALLKKKRK